MEFSAVQLLTFLQNAFHYVLHNVAIPLAINKYIFRKPILDSHAFSILILTIVVFTLRVLYYIFLYPTYFSRFRHLPTPKTRSWLWGNFPPNFIEPMGMTLRTINETVPNEGLIRVYSFLCQERLFVTSPQGISELLVQKGYEFTKPFQLKYNISRIIGAGLACSEGKQHRQQRKHFLPAFSIRHIQNLCPIFWAKTSELVLCLDKELQKSEDSTNNKGINMKNWCSRVTLDIIGVTGMGHDFKSLQRPDSELISIYNNLFAPPPSNFRYFAQISNFINPRIIACLPLQFNRMLKRNSDYIRTETRKIIERKHQSIAKGQDKGIDIIGQALLGDGVFSSENLVDQMMNFLAAGHETTSTSLQWLILVLCRHKDIQDRLRAEVRSSLPASCFPLSAAAYEATLTPITPAMIQGLAYTKAVCNELLRCHPAVPQNIRVSDHDDSYFQGETIPRGTRLLIAPQATNYDPKLWGPDASDFNPDRWIARGQSNAGGAESAYAQMTFSHGPHGCIGKDFAKSELVTIAACLFGSFEFRLRNPNQEITYAQAITVAPMGGVCVYLKRANDTYYRVQHSADSHLT